MRRVLILSATPRKGGNSDILADQVALGAREAGAAVEKIRLGDLRIDPCDACDACQENLQASCILSDDMERLYPLLLDADAIVFATPIYFFSASAQMKCFLDRTYALGGGGDWTALSGKQAAVLLTYADANPLFSGVFNAYGMFRDAFRFLGMEPVDCIHAICSDPGDIRANTAIMTASVILGRRLGSGSIGN